MIELQQAARTYGGLVALHATELEIPKGQTTVLIGPSGCGKSTLLRLILGLIAPSQGQVLFKGIPINAENAETLRRRMGYVIQDGGLFPHLTAEGNVTLMARYLGEMDPEPRLKELCYLVHLPRESLSRYPVELSGGQRQRVGLMRALMLEPEVLLLDEPLGALDPMVRAALQTDLKEVFQRLKKTVIMVTHDMAEAAHLGDRIVLLRDGRIVQVGNLDDLLYRPADPFVTEFITAQRSLMAI